MAGGRYWRIKSTGAGHGTAPDACSAVADARPIGYITANAPVAQLDRALPSEGKGHTFESCRVRQLFGAVCASRGTDLGLTGTDEQRSPRGASQPLRASL